MDPEKTKPEFNPDITDPDIRLPERSAERGPENPLEELVDASQRIAKLEEYLRGATIEYGGLRLKVESVDLDLSLTGTDENGARFVVPKGDLPNYRVVSE